MATKVTWQDRITIDERILAGKPVITGTRVPVQIIVGSLAGGDSIDEVCESYVLTRDDVLAALAYAAETIAQETVHALPHR
jgi:uncharacterized protein (DUF433 family)